ncbi:MAG TPA: hypothetical protein VGI33_05785 [Paenibacillus sp.]
MKNVKSKIIAIAAVSGGGKSTITSRLNQALNNSKTIYFAAAHKGVQCAVIREGVVGTLSNVKSTFITLLLCESYTVFMMLKMLFKIGLLHCIKQDLRECQTIQQLMQ